VIANSENVEGWPTYRPSRFLSRICQYGIPQNLQFLTPNSGSETGIFQGRLIESDASSSFTC